MALLQLPGLMLRAIADAHALAWLTLSLALGWAVLPIVGRLLPRLRFAWYFAARVGGLAILGYAAWISSHARANGSALLRLDRQTTALLLLALFIVAALAWWRWGRQTLQRIRARRRFIVAGEVVFVLFFLFGGALRLVSHGIVDQEKFMDAAFLNSCIHAATMPPPDPWLNPLPINYYYGGYFLMAMPAKILGTPPEIAYNLAIALLWGLAAALVFALAAELTPRIRSAALAVAIVFLAGNLALLPQIADYLRASPPWHAFAFDWWAPSRVIYDHVPGQDAQATINEFPFFAFFHADLHPHLMAIPFALLFAAAMVHLLVSLACARAPFGRGLASGAVRLLFTAWCLGWLAFINGFDFLGWTFALAVALFLASRRIAPAARAPLSLLKAVLVFAVVVAGAVVLFYPFWAHYDPPITSKPFEWSGALAVLPRAAVLHLTNGMPFGFTEFRSGPLEFLLVWGAWLLTPCALGLIALLHARRKARTESRFLVDVAFVAGFVAAVLLLRGVVAGGLLFLIVLLMISHSRRRRRPHSSAMAFLASALGLLLLCELLYVRDSYGLGLQRMNTVFKFHFIAWIMLGIALPFWLREMLRSPALSRRARKSLRAVFSLLVIVALAYPVLAVRNRLAVYESLSLGAPSYDGLRFLQRDLPGDYAAILWLQQNSTDRPVILEATGPPYSLYARIATFAPVRTVLGWANHENVWRGAIPPDIERDARAIYEAPSVDDIRPLLELYGVNLIYIGALERRDFRPEALAKFDTTFPAVYRDPRHDVVIYRVLGLASPAPPDK